MKRNIIIPSIFAIYMGVLAYIGYPYFAKNDQLIEYFLLLAINLLVLFLLHRFLRRRDSQRAESKKRKQAASHRDLRNDNIW